MDTALYTKRPGTTAGDRAYADLKSRLLFGRLPLGRRLVEERLAGLLRVSRTPVREALSRLHAEGLLERHPDGGFRPAAPDVAGVRSLYEARRCLELGALARPLEHGAVHDVAVLEALRDRWLGLARENPEPDTEFVLADEAFHLGLVQAAGNPALVELLRIVNERIRIVRMHDFLTVPRIQATITQHLGILDAVLAGDLPAAAERFRAHLDESMAVVEQRAAAALARMALADRQEPA